MKSTLIIVLCLLALLPGLLANRSAWSAAPRDLAATSTPDHPDRRRGAGGVSPEPAPWALIKPNPRAHGSQDAGGVSPELAPWALIKPDSAGSDREGGAVATPVAPRDRATAAAPGSVAGDSLPSNLYLPLIRTAAVLSTIKSDDFHATNLNSALWQFVNPVGDASVRLNGTNALISVPAGSDHDIWTSGNRAARLMQAANNTNFEIEAKFETAPSGTYAMQGLLVQADAQNFLRFEFYSSDTSLNIFAASFAAGAPTVQINQPISGGAPLYMRVQRAGEQWTQSYSFDGITWITGASFSQPLAVTSVGFYAANAGASPPAYTAAVDYFFNTAAPIVPEDGDASTPTPVPTPVPGSSTIKSDDFNATSLNSGLWQFVNPVGDASVQLNGTNALISVPAGSDHDIWTSGNLGARLMQAANNTNFEIEAKFETAPSGTHAMQGLLVQADAQNFLRFDFYSVDASLNIFAASFTAGAPTVRSNRPIDRGLPLYMRIRRVGDQWTQSYSYDGADWVTNVSFSQPLAVTSVGFYAANAGASPPAYTAAVDYFFNTAAPIVPEDANQALDTSPPSISNLRYDVQTTTLALSWETDKPATAKVEYGTTTAYGSNVVQAGAPGYLHNVEVGGLQPLTIYQARATATDAKSHTSNSENLVMRTKAPNSPAPVIDVWYGADQTFGQRGVPQQWVNILGRVSDPDGVASLVYALNGGTPAPLTIGPDNLRLAAAGDFNIELNHTDLINGVNTVTITATDTLNNRSVANVQVHYTTGQNWPLPYSIDWSSAAAIQQVAQVVDGLWTLDGNSLRPLALGYDRLVDVGDVAWTDYEVTVPITIHRFDPAGFAPTSGGPGVGVLLRWRGHYDWDGHQPRWGYWPMGALGWYRWSSTLGYRLNIAGNNEVMLAEDHSGRKLAFGVRYLFKLRVESRAGQTSLYRLKVWEDGAPEPAAWDLTGAGPAGELGQGSVLLLAHHTDASFGNVTIVPVASSVASGGD